MVHKVSIILTAFNCEQTIAEAVNSAANQDHENTELIVVDDGSSDNTLFILYKLQREVSFELIVNSENKGVSYSRNRGADFATGEFLVFFDDDDVSTSDRISSCLAAWSQFISGRIGLVYSSSAINYDNGSSRPIIASAVDTAVAGRRLINSIIGDHGCFERIEFFPLPASCLFVEKEVFLKFRFDEGFLRVEDLEFALRLAVNNAVFVFDSNISVIRNTTVSYDKGASKNMNFELKLLEKHKNQFRNLDRYNFNILWIALRSHYFRNNWFKMIVVLLSLAVRHPFLLGRKVFTTGITRLVIDAKRKMNFEKI